MEFTSETFYEGRLKPRAENANLSLHCAAPLGGTGIRWIPVEHQGNQNKSLEEVQTIQSLFASLLDAGARWAARMGSREPWPSRMFWS